MFARSTIFILTLFIPLIIITSCRITPSSDEHAPGTKEGYDLAKYYCGTCHGFIPASSLDSNTWATTILPNMAQRLGVEVLWGKEYLNRGATSSGITFKDWKKIVDYYARTSPKEIKTERPETGIIIDTTSFQIKKPRASFQYAKTELAVIDSAAGFIYTSDASTKNVYSWNKKLEIRDSVHLYSASTSASFITDNDGTRKGVFTVKGNAFVGNLINGSVVQLDLNKKLNAALDTISSKLPRPLQTVRGDFNKDGLTDWATCGSTETSGGVFISLQTKEKTYLHKTISDSVGAIRLDAADLNNDGWDDMVVIYAKADETMRLYINDQKGSFIESELMKFPALYGFSSLQLADFNKDGLPDILYTCGANFGISETQQPYHGVYIYLNKGNSKFEKGYFYPIANCTKAIAADINGDGNLDIATIVFNSTSAKNTNENLLWFSQNKNFSFQPYSPVIKKPGRWLNFDVNDYDGDKDADIILGNFTPQMLPQDHNNETYDELTPFFILENKIN